MFDPRHITIAGFRCVTRVEVPEKELTELRRRIAATPWPDKETLSDESLGVKRATMQKLARCWATDYDWRWTFGGYWESHQEQW
jgi:hypothetical protein